MKTLAGVVLLGLAFAAPVQAAVKDAQPNGFTLENSDWVPVAPQVAYAAHLAGGLAGFLCARRMAEREAV